MNTNKYYKLIRVNYEDSEYLRFKNVSDKTGYFTVVAERSMDRQRNLEYSIDGANWQNYDFTKSPIQIISRQNAGILSYNLQVIPLRPGQNIYLRGTNQEWGWQHQNYDFYMDVPHIVAGNLITLLDYQNPSSITSLPNYCFGLEEGYKCGLFWRDTNLVSAKDLTFGNVTTLNVSSLNALFRECYNLVDAPDFSKFVTIGSHGMREAFAGCTSLNANIDLSSVTTVDNNGMMYMFDNCTSFNSIVDLSSVTSVGNHGMSHMFQNCTSLVAPIDVSSVNTIGDNGFDSMFRQCSALTTPTAFSPNLTSIPSYGLHQMYDGCGNLQYGPDVSHITSVSSSMGMRAFLYHCYKIESAYAPNVSNWNTDAMGIWMEGAGRDVPAGTQKTLYAPTGVPIPEDNNSGIPTGWTRVDY